MTIATEIRANLLAIVAAYRKATGLSLGTISSRFYGNAGFLAEFKAGRQTLSIDKLDKVVEKFRAEWPDGASWPYLGAIFMNPPKRRPARKTAEESAHASG